jgi:hypothetical protein
MPRFVILEHRTGEGTHWDFMLEEEGKLRTWSLSAEPFPGTEIPARELPPHRLVYLEYEGEISGGRGIVKRWDRGHFRPKQSPEPNQIQVELEGSRIRGTVELTCIRPDENYWQFYLR